jgi:hypothetical protein
VSTESDLQSEELSPITDIGVVTQGADVRDKPAPGHLVLSETFGKRSGNLNAELGSGNSIYITFARNPRAPPIIDIQVFNETKERYPPTGYTVVECTRSGQSASLVGGGYFACVLFWL